MMKYVLVHLIICAFIGMFQPMNAQIVTLMGNDSIGYAELYRMDMCNCEIVDVPCGKGPDGSIATANNQGIAYGYFRASKQQELFSFISHSIRTTIEFIREETCFRVGIESDYSRYKLLTMDTDIATNQVWLAGDSLYRFDPSPQRIVKEFGPFAPKQAESITWHDGKLYAVWKNEILEVDTFNPSASTVKFILPYSKSDVPDIFQKPSRVHLVSYPTDCGTWITYLLNTAPVALGTFKRGVYRLDMNTGELIFTCPATYEFFNHLRGQAMLPDTLECVELHIDLDDDNSSGEPPLNFRVQSTCPEESITIADVDLSLSARGRDIDSIEIILSNQIDLLNEKLIIQQANPRILSTIKTLEKIVLYNNGDAKAIDFKDALSQIRYIYNVACPEPGERTIHIKVFACAYESDEVITFIDIVDIACAGRDTTIVLCDNEISFDLFKLLGSKADLGGIWNPNKSIFDPKVDAPGKYVYTVDRGNCNPDSAILDIQVGIIPTFNLGNDTSFCDLINLRLGAGQIADHYRWSTGQSDSSIIVSQSGKYVLSLTNDPGCSYSDSVIIQFDSDTTIHLGVFDICVGDSVSFWGGWLKNEGVYKDTFQTFTGCDSILIIEVIVHNPPRFSLGADTSICSGANGVIIILDPKINAASYIWQDGSTGNTLTINDSGIYWLEATDDKGCRYRDSIVVGVGKQKQTDLGVLELCHGDSLIFGAKIIRKSGNYIDTIPSFTGCDSIITLELFVHPVFQNPISGDTLVCEGDSAQLISSIGLHNIVWSMGADTKEIYIHTSGRYSFTALDEHDCLVEASINVRFNAPPILDLIVKSETCKGENDGLIEILNLNVQSDYTYMLDGQILHSSRIENLPSGNYTIIVTDKIGCTTIRVIIIDPGTEISTDLGSDIEISTIDTTLQISTHIISDTTSNITWWVDGEEYGNGENPIEFTPTGDHTIKVLVEDENGCISEDELSIFIRINNDIFIPNTFTPNGDDINDYFRVFSMDGSAFNIEIQIYDRWGNRVFHQKGLRSNTTEKGFWDGRFKGKNLPSAVYVYLVSYQLADGKTGVLKGAVTLLR